MENSFDLLVIGAGPGGCAAAERAAHLGMKVAIVEEQQVGGVCTNTGCIPTKALIYASTLYASMRDCAQFGLRASGVGYDPTEINNYKLQAVVRSREAVQRQLTDARVTLIRGFAQVLGAQRVEVRADDGHTTLFVAPHILIAAGAHPYILPIPGADLPCVYRSKDMLKNCDWDFHSLVIIGGGVVGIEFAHIFSALGKKVTIIEKKDRLLSIMDHEISDGLEQVLRRRGVAVHLGATTERIEAAASGARVHFHQADGSVTSTSGSRVLMAAGRIGHLDGLLAPDSGIETKDGYLKVDSKFCTSVPGVYGIGDILGGIQLAHSAAAVGVNLVERLAHQRPSVMLSTVPSCSFVELPIVPSCIYMHPEVAAVGLSEEQARARGMSVRSGRCEMQANNKTIISREQDGMIKLIFETHSHMLVGAQMLCGRATDMIGEMATAIANGLTAEQLGLAMRAHPTYNEAVGVAVRDYMSKRRFSC